MEPADIDWVNVDSRFVRDELYENLNAPKWLDLLAPDSSSAGDDEAWFCRPDCRHPKTHEDFLKFSPSPKLKKPKKLNSPQMMPLGERKGNSQRDGNANNSLKRRGAILSLLLPPPSPAREPAKNKASGKKFRDDLENQNPNLLANNCTSTSTKTSNRPPMKAVTLKDAIKSSAEKKATANQEGNEEEMRRSKKPLPRLKSTLSARNLFSGRDILGQISEFCHEIKKLAVGKEKNSAASAAAKEVAKKEDKKERKVLVDTKSEGVETEVGKSVLKEVRACPPTPQRFPSPSGRRLRSPKSAANMTSSPLKPVPSELDQGTREEKKALIAKDEECSRASAASAESEGSSMDMFWFLKPCTYLVK